mgnify:CR=1 FL=1
MFFGKEAFGGLKEFHGLHGDLKIVSKNLTHGRYRVQTKQKRRQYDFLVNFRFFIQISK